MTLLVTRPEPQASQWARRLNDAGVPARSLPLLETAAPEDDAARARLAALWHDLPDIALLMFVSPAAVHWFAQARPDALAWPAGTRAAAPGPGTARALVATFEASGLQPAAVVSPPPDSAQFDSEHLWPELAPHDWQDRRVVIVSGGGADGSAQGRRWLQERLQAAGARVDTVATYVRRSAAWSPEQWARARQAWTDPDGHVWLFSSSQALPVLVERLGPVPASARALVTHPRVADAAHELGFRHVVTTRPDLDSVAQARRDLSPRPPTRPDLPGSDDGIDTIHSS